MKSIAPGSFISICPPKGHPSKRAGPFITIRTSTFVELLGNAREWDAKFPALAGASRAYLLESFAFADDFCSYATEEERRQRSGVLARQVKRFLLYGALFLALLSPTVGAAQDDFFPPPGIFIPCCSSGGTGGHTGATYGENGQSAWRQVWGAAPGDIVTFRFVLRSRSAGSLHAWPQTTGGTDMQYLGDHNNIYEKWYWNTGQRDSGGTFCLDCPWQFTANYWNPWIYIDYWDSGDGWDVDLNVVNIQTPRAKPLVDQFTKDKNQQYADISGNLSRVFSAAGTLMASGGERASGVILAGLSFGSWLLQRHFQRIANDPWDPDYEVPYEPYVDPQAEADLAWVCPDVQQNDNTGGWLTDLCWQMRGYSLWSEALLKAIAVTNDRVESCIQVGAGCEGWQRDRGVAFFHGAGDHLAYLGSLHGWLGQHILNWQIADPYDAAGQLFYYRDVLYDAYSVFQGVQ